MCGRSWTSLYVHVITRCRTQHSRLLQLFLEEERERELETLHERGIAESLNRSDGAEEGTAPTYTTPRAEATSVSKQTTETLMAGEKIMEALDLADSERKAFADHEQVTSKLGQSDAMKLQPPPRNPILAAYNSEPEEYVLRVIEKVPSTALHDALLVLPFQKVVSLMNYLNIWAQKVGELFGTFLQMLTCCQEWNIILTSRIIFFLLRTHHHQIVANQIMRTSLIPLRKHLRTALQRQKETISYNLAALQYLRRKEESEHTARFYEDELTEEGANRSQIAEGKKRKRVYLKS